MMRSSTRILLFVPAAFLIVPVMASLQSSTAPIPAGQIDVAKLLDQPQTFESPTRIERTAKIDGVFRRDEWDLLWEDKTIVAPAPVLNAHPTPAANAVPAGPPAAGPAKDQGTAGNPRVPPATSDPKNKVPPPPAPPSAPPAQAPVATTPLVAPPPPPPVSVVRSTYMNWEPGKLYFASSAPAGNDLLISIDGQGNGFDKGQDNLELRISPGAVGAPAHVTARMLYSDGGASPAWHDAPGFVLSTQAMTGTAPNGDVLIEATVVDPGINLFFAQMHSQFGIRADIIPTSTPPIDATIARVTTLVFLDDVRSTDLPDNLSASVGDKGRKVVPGDTMSLRFEFVASSPANPIKAVDISGQGPLDDLVNSLRVPIPPFDGKGRATIDFPTRMSPNAPIGYGVVQAILTGTGWGPAKVEASVRVAPPVELDTRPITVKGPSKNGKIVGQAFVLSNIDTREQGNFEVVVPAGWQVVDGSDKTFLLYGKGAKATREFVVQAPPDARGTFMLTVRVTFLGSTIEKPCFVTIL